MTKRLVIMGATGMVGGYALRYALDDLDVGTVTVIGRRTLGLSHAKQRKSFIPISRTVPHSLKRSPVRMRPSSV